jgi:hypothetical protein
VKVRTIKLAVLMAKGTDLCCPKGCHCCGMPQTSFVCPEIKIVVGQEAVQRGSIVVATEPVVQMIRAAAIHVE